MKTQNFLVPLTNPVNTDYFIHSSKLHIGKIYGVVINENTTTKKMKLIVGRLNSIGSIINIYYE